MADARPSRHNRPPGFYAPEPTEPAPGLSPVKTKSEPSPTAKLSVRCPKCQIKLWLVDGATETTCSCGEVVGL